MNYNKRTKETGESAGDEHPRNTPGMFSNSASCGEDFWLRKERKVIRMAVKRDYYEILGVSKDADEGTIKKAYRRLAKKYHPDSNKDNAEAEQRFKEVTEAYGVLSDPEKKKLYDRFGHAAFDQNAGWSQDYGAGRTQAGRGQGGFQEFHFEGGEMDGLFEDLFEKMFRGGSAKGSRRSDGFGFGGGPFPKKGEDLYAEASISFEEAVFGCEKRILLRDRDGAGSSVQVRIPAGIEDGKSIRLKGKGMAGGKGGEAGDLFLKITVGKKPGFERKGMDLYTSVSIPFVTAVLGGEAEVATLNGRVLCRIAPGTQSGSRIRLKGKGVVSMRQPGVYGDLYVTVQIQVPKELTPQAKQKLREFAAACGTGGSRGVA